MWKQRIFYGVIVTAVFAMMFISTRHYNNDYSVTAAKKSSSFGITHNWTQR